MRLISGTTRCGGPLWGGQTALEEIEVGKDGCRIVDYEGHGFLLDYVRAAVAKKTPGQEVRGVTMVRDPILRELSALQHCRAIVGQPCVTPNCYNRTNFQTQFHACPVPPRNLEPCTWFEPCGASWNDAMASLKQLYFVGVTEYYEASFCMLAEKIYGTLPHSLTFPCRSLCSGDARPHVSSAQSTIDHLPAHESETIMRNTEQDRLLYHAVVQDFRFRAREIEKRYQVSLLCDNAPDGGIIGHLA
eukprot:CAMPEP_0119135280 /NCGR_PEP_ID=MMETSP1310-20130426/18972_1 /TAXON_ID=464262 /ORGANISM="Genus nov. species nov., Strain RCC2339" /LENGTH=245 /DNA_ID=CAMNT_0007126149 /DNA_START=60 /DNA_END=794 /DNA_ORIENTATION=+